MATWTNVDNADLGVGDPIRSIDIVAMNDNVTAITEGATGAPKIVGAAIKPIGDFPTLAVNAADTYHIALGTTVVYGVTAVHGYNYQNLATITINNYSGSIRFKAQHAGQYWDGNNTYASNMRILLNGVQQQAWSNVSANSVTRSRDISVSPGDVITWQHASTVSFGTSSAYRIGEYADDCYGTRPCIIQATLA